MYRCCLLYTSKVALDDIAMSKGIEFEELLDEIEAIVYSGTKLNIDYRCV